MKNTAKKIKEIIKGSPKEAFGTNPSDPWSAKYGIAEGALDQYLLARGINPKFISRETKISHAKSTQFIKWKQDHMRESMTVHHSPTEIRQHALKKAQQANKVVKRSDVGTDGLHKEESKPTALEKFRKASDEREKKHAEIEKKQSKDGSGMSSAIGRLQKHLNKEESELDESSKDNPRHPMHQSDPSLYKKTPKSMTKQYATHAGKHFSRTDKIDFTLDYKKTDKEAPRYKNEEVEHIDELKKSTVKSWLGKQEVVPPKKPGMDRKAHNQRIKTRSKSWDSALDRLTGRKPTSEDIWQDGQAPTQTSFDGANAPDNTEPSTSHIKTKSAMSKSARMIKSLYKHHNVKEELYDHEKEDKSVATYGKKPKMQKVDQEQNYGDNSPKAAAVLSGGKTLTGKTRDTLEIDPEMRKPTRPDGKKEEQK